MEPFEIIAKCAKAYDKCSSYRDRGRISVSVPGWTEINFETFFVRPNQFLLRLRYGSQEIPIQNDVFWSNGTEAYEYRDGLVNGCRDAKSILALAPFGLRRLDFEVPGMLISQIGSYGNIMTPVFRMKDDATEDGCFHLIFDSQEQRSLELDIDKVDFGFRRVGSKYNIDKTEQVTAQAMLLKSLDSRSRLPLLLGQPEILQLSSITTECIYDEVLFNSIIPEEQLSFEASNCHAPSHKH